MSLCDKTKCVVLPNDICYISLKPNIMLQVMTFSNLFSYNIITVHCHPQTHLAILLKSGLKVDFKILTIVNDRQVKLNKRV